MSHDLASTAGRIEEHGGKLLVAPMEIPETGRMLSEPFDYSAWSLGDADPVAGRPTMTSAWDGVPAHWSVYFATDDTDAAAERVPAAGDRVQHGPSDSPHGRLAVIEDPNGAVFTLIAR